jgi:SAM-dependent methyltransferase
VQIGLIRYHARMHNSTTRFSSRVANYVKYRPGYPEAVYAFLADRCALTADSQIADIGSGTGISSELFLRHGARVIGFSSSNGTAEATGLAAASIDLIIAGQAYHWFDPQPAAREFRRVLKPSGWVALMWNDRQTESTPFLRDYEALLQTFSTDYAAIDHKNSKPERLGIAFERAQFDNAQHLDYDGIAGRLLSSSYAPEHGHPNHVPMMTELRRIFDQHQHAGQVDLRYTTDVFVGRV